jgi:bacillithiol biosynthesis cysteine-adding enzyme BshC
MATEDHDKEEIQSAYVNGKKYTWHTPQTGPVGRFSNEGMMDLLEEIQNDFPDFFAHDLQNVFKEAYQLATLAAATRYIVHALFGKYGVIVLDADDTRLKSQFSNIIINDILEGVSHKEVEHASKKLSESYSLQAQGREINFFYLTNSYRERIVKSAGGFETIDKEHQWTIETLRMEVEQNPERFSPNVIMRPVYQEIILPNIAYIGGGAEIAYWLPLKGIFHAYNIPFPALLLRNSAIIIDQVNSHRLKNAGLKIADIFKSLDELKKRKSLERFGEALHLDSIKIAMKPELEMLEKLAKEVSPELKEASQAFEKRIHHTIDAFSEKLIREAKKHNDIEVLRLNELFKHMYPEGSLQERKESIVTFVLRHGLHVIDDLLSVCDPVHNRFVVLQY